MSARPDLTIVIPCSKTKRLCPQPAASAEELTRGRFGYDDRLAPFAVEARELYLGRQHRAMVRAVDTLRTARPDFRVELAIISAGYGLLDEHDRVVSYEAALGASLRTQVERGRALGLPNAVRELAAGTACTVFALSAAYLAACALPDARIANVIYLAGSDAESAATATVSSGRREARHFGKAEREIRGYVLGLFLDDVAARGIDALAEARAGAWLPVGAHQAAFALP